MMLRLLALGLLAFGYVNTLACTIFLVARNGQVLMGANEDMSNEVPYDKHWVRFQPKNEKVKYGFVTFGYNSFPLTAQAGMNEAGIFYDYNALPQKDEGPAGKTKAGIGLAEQFIGSCATVAEVISMIQLYDWVGLSAGQMVIGDATGASAIVERNAITYRGTADFQVGTNFRTSETPKDKISCWRYNKCQSVLGLQSSVTTDSVRSLLEDTMPFNSTKGKSISWYSQVCDLKAKKMLLFRKGDFSKVVILDIPKETAKEARRIDMDELMARQGVVYKP
ncbi:MAG: hypothetical protein KF784_09190 [Fimbriimonadaceae bacterium]|nr:hypothetical protein [Fimbriimonadaceae bacterium]